MQTFHNWADIKAAEKRGREQRAAGETVNADTQRFAACERCIECGAMIGMQVDGDCTMCTTCGTWHHTIAIGGLTVTMIVSSAQAAFIAREPAEPYRLLAAMRRSAQQLEEARY